LETISSTNGDKETINFIERKYMKNIHMVITYNGDGSNSIQFVQDQEVLDRMEELVDEDSETYSSGDGLQVTSLEFPEDFDLDTWCKTNCIDFVTLEDLEDYAY